MSTDNVQARAGELVTIVHTAAGEAQDEFTAALALGELFDSAETLAGALEAHSGPGGARVEVDDAFDHFLRFASQVLVLDDPIREQDLADHVIGNAGRIVSLVEQGRAAEYRGELPGTLVRLRSALEDSLAPGAGRSPAVTSSAMTASLQVIIVALAAALERERSMGVSELDQARAEVTRIQAEIDLLMVALSKAMARLQELEGKGADVTREDLDLAVAAVQEASESLAEATRRIRLGGHVGARAHGQVKAVDDGMDRGIKPPIRTLV
jgi:hypothetical protein